MTRKKTYTIEHTANLLSPTTMTVTGYAAALECAKAVAECGGVVLLRGDDGRARVIPQPQPTQEPTS